MRTFSDLHRAAHCGDVETVEKLVGDGNADIDLQDLAGFTALHHAAKHGHNKIVMHLVNARASLDKLNDRNQTALALASKRGYSKVVETLLHAGADVHGTRTDHRQTPLFHAVCKGWVPITKALLKAGADVNDGFKNGKVLYWATCKGYSSMVKILLAAGADPNCAMQFSDPSRYFGLLHPGKLEDTPLHAACRNGSDDIAEMLIAAGADIDARLRDEWTPLHVAVCSSQRWVEKLSRHDISKLFGRMGWGRQRSGWDTDLGAVNCMNFLGNIYRHQHLRLVDLLVQTASEQNRVDYINGGTLRALNRTALHLAIACGNGDMVDKLLALGANISAADKNGWQALHFAACFGHVELLDKLRTAGADLNACGIMDGITPLHCAIHGLHVHVVRKLVEMGALIDEKRQNVLHYALSTEQRPLFNSREKVHLEEIVQILIDAGVDVNRENRSGWSQPAIILASIACNSKLVKMLIDAGANVNQRALNSRVKYNALEEVTAKNFVISETERTKCADLLLDAGAVVSAEFLKSFSWHSNAYNQLVIMKKLEAISKK